jgi:hypothetical protein
MPNRAIKRSFMLLFIGTFSAPTVRRPEISSRLYDINPTGVVRRIEFR